MGRTGYRVMCQTRAGAAGLAFLITLASAPVLAQQATQRIPVREILNRIDRLESDLSNLRLAPPSGLGQDAAIRLEQVELELRRLSGAVERLEFESSRRSAQSERRILDLETRLQALESGGSQRPAAPLASATPQPFDATIQQLAPQPLVPRAPQPGIVALNSPIQIDQSPDLSAIPGAPLQGATPTPPEPLQPQVALAPTMQAPVSEITQPALAPLPQPTPITAPLGSVQGNADAEYRQALQLLNQGRFDEAGASFESIAATFGEHPAVGQSKYWLGDMHLRLGRFELAAKSFLEAFRGWPSGPKAPDSLLKLGITLAGLGQRNEACLTFTQFANRYPQASPVLLRRAEIEAQRAQCDG